MPHFVGHSNGTYLVAQALCDYPAARFKHIVFAGSIVRGDYDWSSFTKQKPPRVEKVLNFVATQDRVVALVPKALQQMQVWRRRRIGLGSAGHDGFDQDIKDVRVEWYREFKVQADQWDSEVQKNTHLIDMERLDTL